MSFATDAEDSISMGLNGKKLESILVLEQLIERYGINVQNIGRLEVGTESISDKSKSIKSSLMRYLNHYGNFDVEGAMNINACYGGTAALFNSIAWMESESWDGKDAVVIMTDVAVYPEGPARVTGGAGAIAIWLTPHAPIVFEPIRCSHMEDIYDFYKPDLGSEYPRVDGKLSLSVYFRSLQSCYRGFKAKYRKILKQPINTSSFDQLIFHSPFHRQVKKSFLSLIYDDL